MTTITIEKAANTIAATEKTFIFTKEQFLTFQENWKAKKHHSAIDHIAYNLIRGFEPTRGFTPIKSAHKIESNSCDAWRGYNTALHCLNFCFAPISTYDAGIPARFETLTTARKQRFKTYFGVDLTEELRNAFPKLEKR